MTSSSAGKAAAPAKGHDTAGRWTTPTGADMRMQVDRAKYIKEGLCFTCGKKGHIGKDCLDRKPRKEVRVVTKGEDIPLVDMTGVEEVKE